VAGLKINICAIGKLNNSAPECEIIETYLRRIPWNITISQLETKDKFPIKKQKLQEGELLLKSVAQGNYIIAMDERGKEFSSVEFSKTLEKISQPICFLIGGAHGLSEEVKTKANMLISLSQMTLPHALARAMLIEQIQFTNCIDLLRKTTA
jgi:23S rRNA (pseudouridine1915-N3)-methyltransferase